MPAKNSIKIYIENGYYHVYNRGVEKRDIFLQPDDYKVFLHCLKQALLPPEKILSSFPQGQTLQGLTLRGNGIPKPPKNYYGQIELLAYTLMPNHFHLLVHQIQNRCMDQFMQSILTRYTMFFNKTKKRVGGLFQGRYKGINITEDSYLLHLSRYIHRNASPLTKNLADWYSSYGDYLGIKNTEWVKTDMILESFKPGTLPFLKHTNTYKSFVEYESEELDEYVDTRLALENP
jgi:putative transposase